MEKEGKRKKENYFHFFLAQITFFYTSLTHKMIICLVFFCRDNTLDISYITLLLDLQTNEQMYLEKQQQRNSSLNISLIIEFFNIFFFKGI